MKRKKPRKMKSKSRIDKGELLEETLITVVCENYTFVRHSILKK